MCFSSIPGLRGEIEQRGVRVLRHADPSGRRFRVRGASSGRLEAQGGPGSGPRGPGKGKAWRMLGGQWLREILDMDSGLDTPPRGIDKLSSSPAEPDQAIPSAVA